MRPLSHAGHVLRRFGRDRSGTIAILFAFALSVATIASALAVDEGAVYLQRREAQAAADLAAIAAARDPAHAFAVARQALMAAGMVPEGQSRAHRAAGTHGVRLVVATGRYTPDPALAVAARFVPGATPPTAVRVSLQVPGTLYFARALIHPPTIGVTALASADPSVAFSVGSSLARLNGGLGNAVLNGLLGSNVTLSAVSYDGLLSARISLFGFLDALAQELGITAGTYQDVLDVSADRGVLAKAIADVLTGADAMAALRLSQALAGSGHVPIGRLIDLGPAAGLALGTGRSSGYLASLSALQVLAATAALSDGTHQVALNLGAAVPGLVSLSMQLAVGEPQQFAAWFALGPGGTVARTAQVRLQFVATLGGSGLAGARLRVPLYLELAYADAAVQSAACPTAGAVTGSAVIATQPGVARLVLGEAAEPAFGDFSLPPNVAPARLVDLPLLKVTGSAAASIGQTHAIPLAFSAADVVGGIVKTATTNTPTQSLVASLLGNMSLQVRALGLGLPSTSAIGATVAGLITPLAPTLDAAIDTTLAALGLSLGSADVTVYGVNCGRAVLVG